jgi:hypothetical protein
MPKRKISVEAEVADILMGRVNIDTEEKLIKHFGKPVSTDELAMALVKGYTPFIRRVEEKKSRRRK